MTELNEEKIRILYVDDEPAYRRLFCRELRDDDRFLVDTGADGAEALDKLSTSPADIVLADLRMPGMDGIELLKEIRKRHPEIFVLILTAVDSAAEAVKAMKAGAYDYILKPFDFSLLQMQLGKILQHRRLLKSNTQSSGADYRFENLVGQDPLMFELFEQISRIAPTNATVLIRGESGTGKELIAAAIHAKSLRSGQVFIPVNCAALTEGLINSALFGHEKGAFTGAVTRKMGFFERASKGTIFLDEIGDIPLQTQIALLRVLELGTFQRVGGTETIQVDTRIICATNRNLEIAMQEKAFREDLFFRLNVVTLTAPPLRERPSDIPLLADFFLHKCGRETGKSIRGIDKSAMVLLTAYRWPGNVRELANVMERAVLFCPGPEVRPEHLPAELTSYRPRDFNLTLHSSSLPGAEEALIRQVLEAKGWNLKQAAAALHIARGTLYSKIEKYRIEKSS